MDLYGDDSSSAPSDASSASSSTSASSQNTSSSEKSTVSLPASNEEIVAACNTDDVDAMRRLLDDGLPAQIEVEVNSFRMPAVRYAASCGSVQVVRLLFARGSSMASTGYIHSALIGAVQTGQIEVVRALMDDYGANHRARHLAEGVVNEAVMSGHLDMVRLLFEEYNAEFPDRSAYNDVCTALSRGHMDVVDYVLRQRNAVVMQPVQTMDMLLCVAGCNNLDLLRWMVERCAPNAAVYNIYIVQAMCAAAKNGHLESMAYLTERHAWLRSLLPDDVLTVCAACTGGHVAALRWLLQNGYPAPTPRMLRRVDGTWLAGGPAMVRVLVTEFGFSVSDVLHMGKSPLLFAIKEQPSVVPTLVELGADPSAPSDNGLSMVDEALRACSYDAARYLIEQCHQKITLAAARQAALQSTFAGRWICHRGYADWRLMPPSALQRHMHAKRLALLHGGFTTDGFGRLPFATRRTIVELLALARAPAPMGVQRALARLPVLMRLIGAVALACAGDVHQHPLWRRRTRRPCYGCDRRARRSDARTGVACAQCLFYLCADCALGVEASA